MKMIIGQKAGMTRIYDENGRSFAVTIVKACSNIIDQIKTKEKDGYSAIKVKVSKIQKDLEKTVKSCEFRVEDSKSYKKGKTLTLEQFQKGDKVSVTGVSKGKGFAGTIKRHNFRRGPAGHGSNNVREPGSIGAQQPQRVIPGKKMAGHMGAETVTIKNLTVFDSDKDFLLVVGAIPGNNKSFIKIISDSFSDEPVSDDIIDEEVSESVVETEPEVSVEEPVVEAVDVAEQAEKESKTEENETK
jgi:large subunit ribosomal protein L3